MTILALVAVALADAAAASVDITLTEKGIRKGKAVEGKALLVELSGSNKPLSRVLYSWELGFIGVVFTAAVLATGIPANLPYAAAVLAIGALFSDALKHVQSSLKWRYILAGGVLDYAGFPYVPPYNPKPHTVMQKLLGPWIFRKPGA